jgi:hypothetical protein
MTVGSLIERLKECNQDATVVLCMDWSGHPDKDKLPEGQWEDNLGDISTSNKSTGKYVYLLNESFK